MKWKPNNTTNLKRNNFFFKSYCDFGRAQTETKLFFAPLFWRNLLCRRKLSVNATRGKTDRAEISKIVQFWEISKVALFWRLKIDIYLKFSDIIVNKKVAIKHTPHFGVRSALALNLGGVRMTAPTSRTTPALLLTPN